MMQNMEFSHFFKRFEFWPLDKFAKKWGTYPLCLHRSQFLSIMFEIKDRISSKNEKMFKNANPQPEAAKDQDSHFGRLSVASAASSTLQGECFRTSCLETA